MNDPTQDIHDRMQAKLERNEKFLQRIDAMKSGEQRVYDDLTQIADVLSLRPDPPTIDQLRQIRERLIAQQDAIARLLIIIEPLIEGSSQLRK